MFIWNVRFVDLARYVHCMAIPKKKDICVLFLKFTVFQYNLSYFVILVPEKVHFVASSFITQFVFIQIPENIAIQNAMLLGFTSQIHVLLFICLVSL